MATMRSVIHFPDGGELIITREMVQLGRIKVRSAAGVRDLLTPGMFTVTYNGKPVSDAKVNRLLAGRRDATREPPGGDGG